MRGGALLQMLALCNKPTLKMRKPSSLCNADSCFRGKIFSLTLNRTKRHAAYNWINIVLLLYYVLKASWLCKTDPTFFCLRSCMLSICDNDHSGTQFYMNSLGCRLMPTFL